jgi:hypothetical protein
VKADNVKVLELQQVLFRLVQQIRLLVQIFRVSTVFATQTITVTNKIIAPAKVTYRAVKSVSLNAGFQANLSSVFKAETGGYN